MGKILDALRGTEVVGPPALEAPAPPRAEPDAPETDGDTLREEGDEVPFIEIGPRREVRGSPSVLAVRADAVPLPSIVPPPTPGPHGVRFRPLRPALARPPMPASVVTYHDPQGAVSRQYLDLLDALVEGPAEGARALMLTPAFAGVDAAGVALNLGVTAARQGSGGVLVIDGDLRRPSLAERLGLPDRPGLGEVMSGKATLEQALRPTAQEGLEIVGAGRMPVNVPLVRRTALSLLQQFKHRFSLVLLIAPRWDGLSDVVQFGAACDAVYLVVSEQEAECSQVSDLCAVIPEQGAKLAGCILAAG
jgi:tyrosine-protein kinase Etk/Wzc